MARFPTLLRFALAGATVALAQSETGPAPPRASRYCYPHTDWFDDIKLKPSPSVTYAGVINGLDYSDFAVGTPSKFPSILPASIQSLLALLGLTPILNFGIQPQTPNNTLGLGPFEALHNGKLSPSPFGSVNATSKVAFFDLEVVSYACVILNPLSSAIPTGCVMSVKGYNSAGDEIASEELAYSPESFGQAKMDSKDFYEAGFQNVSRVTFGVASGGSAGGSAITAMLLDGVGHCDYLREDGFGEA